MHKTKFKETGEQDKHFSNSHLHFEEPELLSSVICPLEQFSKHAPLYSYLY